MTHYDQSRLGRRRRPQDIRIDLSPDSKYRGLKKQDPERELRQAKLEILMERAEKEIDLFKEN